MQRLGIAGAGTMGCGIAQVALQAGLHVTVYDQAPGAAEAAPGRIGQGMQGAVDRGKITSAGKDEALARLTVASALDGLGGADVVIEAIVEDLAAKRALFAELDRLCPPPAILASNTSSLSITAIAAATVHTERVVGMHFFNPVPAMRLVEVIPGLATAPEVVRDVTQLATSLGKTPVESKNRPGFIVNRIATAFYTEPIRLVEEGAADEETIDRLVRAMGFRMGPFELMDLVGLDVCQAVGEAMYTATFGEPRYRPHARLAEMVDAGHLGRKSGKGFYEHRSG